MIDKKLEIDGYKFDIPVIELPRKADVLDRSSERTEDGGLYREIIGTYLNYNSIVFGTLNDTVQYDKLFKVMSYPVPYHKIKLPIESEYASFKGYISSVQDAVDTVLEDSDGIKTRFKALVCNFIAIEPTIKGVTYDQYLDILPSLLSD